MMRLKYKAQAESVLKKVMGNPEFEKHKNELDMFISVVWFDYLSDITKSPKVVRNRVRKIVSVRKDPAFDRAMVVDWLVNEMNLKRTTAEARMAVRESSIAYDEQER
jgi:hypothetical protein